MRNSLWDQHLERLSAIHDLAPPRPVAIDADEALRGEWNALPPGRLGRRLLVDVDRYLDFFATARD